MKKPKSLAPRKGEEGKTPTDKMEEALGLAEPKGQEPISDYTKNIMKKSSTKKILLTAKKLESIVREMRLLAHVKAVRPQGKWARN